MEGSEPEPEPPKIGRLRNSAIYLMYVGLLVHYGYFGAYPEVLPWRRVRVCTHAGGTRGDCEGVGDVSISIFVFIFVFSFIFNT